MHELLVMPCRHMAESRRRLRRLLRAAGGCAGRHHRRAAGGTTGRQGGAWRALFSRRYGQSTGVVIFDRVFVPWERVFYAGEWEHAGALTTTTPPTTATAASARAPASATC
jgi:4-hydroxybutyryl-CoA dehydratase / vinylacetyl-CoA-Delta-isomerase